MRREEIVAVTLDTTYQWNFAGPGQAARLDNLFRRLDLTITTRLHGMGFGLRNWIPVVAIDAVDGGAKVSEQAAALGWPLVFDGATVTEPEIQQDVARCLNGDMRTTLTEAPERARDRVERMHATFREPFPWCRFHQFRRRAVVAAGPTSCSPAMLGRP